MAGGLHRTGRRRRVVRSRSACRRIRPARGAILVRNAEAVRAYRSHGADPAGDAVECQAGGHFQLVVFDGPLEVDWNVGPLSLARRAPWHVLLFAREAVPLATPPKLSPEDRRTQCQERLVFLWAMAPIAVKYIARGDTSRAVGQIGLVRNAFIALWRLAETGCGTVNSLNQPIEPELKRMLPVLGSTIEPNACLAALHQLCDRTVELHPRLAMLGVEIPEDMPAQLARLAGEATTPR
jgi:hypothetical protein